MTPVEDNMDIDGVMDNADTQPQQSAHDIPSTSGISNLNTHGLPPHPHRDHFRNIQVKVHIRRPERDSWVYLGRGLVTQELTGHSSRVVVRAVSTGKVMAMFSEGSDLQAEKRGNFVVIGCVEASDVVSWSLNALSNSETLRLLASIELACYKCKQAVADPRHHTKVRRRIERVIKDDRRRRHRRRKDQEVMIDAFSKQNLSDVAADAEAQVPPRQVSI